jgi:hypothetical protein
VWCWAAGRVVDARLVGRAPGPLYIWQSSSARPSIIGACDTQERATFDASGDASTRNVTSDDLNRTIPPRLEKMTLVPLDALAKVLRS